MPTLKRAYCFTLNNYTDVEEANIKRVCGAESIYAIYGREVGESGTPHLQGYIFFKKSYRFTTIKDRYLPRCHIEIAAGSPDANRRYCSKGGDFVEFGEIPTGVEGKSTRDEIAKAFVASMSRGKAGLAEFADSNPGTWYYSGHNLLRNWLSVQPVVDRADVRARWVYGDPGVGKSRFAHGELPDAYIKEPRTKWWNGYLLENDVIIDDFGPGGIDINHLLRWFDRYKCLVESKGGMLPLHAINFIVTSNYSPESCFTDSFGVVHPQISALLRRINVISM